MFQIGLEFDFKTNLRSGKWSIGLVSVLGMIFPFALGFLVSTWFFERLPGPRPDLLGFRLFFAIAMSITAIPILGRIFIELGLSHTRTAALTVGAAAIDDVAGWFLLGVVTLIAQRQISLFWLSLKFLVLLTYLLFTLFVARPMIRKIVAEHLRLTGELGASMIGSVLFLLFLSGAVTSAIGVFAIIGGFVLGVSLHEDRRFVEEWNHRVSPLVNTLFLPIFFAYTGLRTDIGSLVGLNAWIECGLVMAVAFVSKFGGAYLGAVLAGEDSRSAVAIGVCMNTRALMELVAINIGYDIGVLPRRMFTMLVIMAIASTFIATPLIRWLLEGQEKEKKNVLLGVPAV